MNGIYTITIERPNGQDSYTVWCETCNQNHNPEYAPVAVAIWWSEPMSGDGLWVATVVASDGGESHNVESYYDYYQSRVIEAAKEDMKENHNNFYGDATEIRVFTKAGNLKKTISIR